MPQRIQKQTDDMNANSCMPAAEPLPGYDRKTRRLEWLAFLVLAKLALAAVVLAVVHSFDFAGGAFAEASTKAMASVREPAGQDTKAAQAKPPAIKAENAQPGSPPGCCITPQSSCA